MDWPHIVVAMSVYLHISYARTSERVSLNPHPTLLVDITTCRTSVIFITLLPGPFTVLRSWVSAANSPSSKPLSCPIELLDYIFHLYTGIPLLLHLLLIFLLLPPPNIPLFPPHPPGGKQLSVFSVPFTPSTFQQHHTVLTTILTFTFSHVSFLTRFSLKQHRFNKNSA